MHGKEFFHSNTVCKTALAAQGLNSNFQEQQQYHRQSWMGSTRSLYQPRPKNRVSRRQEAGGRRQEADGNLNKKGPGGRCVELHKVCS